MAEDLLETSKLREAASVSLLCRSILSHDMPANCLQVRLQSFFLTAADPTLKTSGQRRHHQKV
jgi:hypothetical protein